MAKNLILLALGTIVSVETPVEFAIKGVETPKTSAQETLILPDTLITYTAEPYDGVNTIVEKFYTKNDKISFGKCQNKFLQYNPQIINKTVYQGKKYRVPIYNLKRGDR